jgi:sporulation protein YlmC with PRC-barrel domain
LERSDAARTHICQVRGFLIVLGAALHVFYQMGRCTGDSAPKSANVSVEGCKPLRSQGVVMHSPVLVFLALLLLSGPARAQSTPPAAGAPKFIQIDDDALLSSRLIGLNVQNSIGENIGKIEDVAFEGGQLSGVVLSIGDILGQGQRYIAVDPSSISINYTEVENKWRATLNAKIEQLKSAPEFRYEGKWKR